MKFGVDIDAKLTYDANGNIKAMVQNGLVINNSPVIDHLTYTYNTNSNKLLKVEDTATTNYKLGDFQNGSSGTGNDYSYDANGNLTPDANKDISSITYNYLNLPSVITVTGKGTITYTYDAAGNKLKKVTVDNTVSPAKTNTTLYVGGAVYENDTLQLIAHEEGRIRPLRDGSGNITSFTYDYFLKDHLGNPARAGQVVRMVLTEETKTDPYPPASMETAQATTEEALIANLPQTRVSKPSGYPTDNYTNPNNNVAKVNGSGNKIGPSIILKVMAGDKFNIRVSSWYKKNGATPNSPNSIATDLVTYLISSLTGTGGPVHGTVTSTQLNNSGVIPTAANSFLSNQPAPGSTKPKAYINWVLLDEQFKFVQSGSGAEQVGNDNTLTIHTKTNLAVGRNGYLYVFVSNETPNIDVFFDNLQVTHIHGPILEESHYYPFGLTMAGISSKAANVLENRKKFTSQELNSDLGLDWYEFRYRMHDPQTGRFTQIDPLADKFIYNSTYAYAENKPTLGIDLEGLELLPFNSAWFRISASQSNTFGTNSWNTQVNITAKNVPGAFKDNLGNPLFNAGSVGVTSSGLTDNNPGAQLSPGNNLPASPGWTWGQGDPEPTPNVAGGYMGRNYEANQVFAGRSGAAGAAPQEIGNWFKLYTHDLPIWNAYSELSTNKAGFSDALSLVNKYERAVSFAMGGIRTDVFNPAVKSGLVNFVLDGAVPSLNFKDLRGSLESGLTTMWYGIQLLKNNGTSVQKDVMNAYNSYLSMYNLMNPTYNFDLNGIKK